MAEEKKNEVGDYGLYLKQFSWKIVSGGAGVLNIELKQGVVQALAAEGANLELLKDIGETTNPTEVLNQLWASMKK